MRVRDEIYQEALNRINNYPDITIETELGPMHLYDYIHHINNPGFYGGELEITIASDIYNINIVTYDDNINNGFSFIRYYNNNKDENHHLLILTNTANIHFRLAYYKTNSNIDMNYQIPEIKHKNNININDENLKDNENELNFENNNDKSNLKEPTIKNIFDKFNNKTLNEILMFYNNKLNSLDLYDIYYYLYYLKKMIIKKENTHKNLNRFTKQITINQKNFYLGKKQKNMI